MTLMTRNLTSMSFYSDQFEEIGRHENNKDKEVRDQAS